MTPSVQTIPNRGKTIKGAIHTFVKSYHKVKSPHCYNKKPYYLDEHGTVYRSLGRIKYFQCHNGPSEYNPTFCMKVIML